jgi:hypothetical protein
MKLFELFDKIAPYKKIHDDDDILDYQFTINDTNFEANFFKLNPNEPWEIMFNDTDISNQYQKPENDEESGMGMTNKGNAIQVMSTIIAITKEFLKLKKPTEITFSSGNQSKTKLYLRLIKMFQQSGWKLSTEKDEQGYTNFHLFKE